MHYRNSSIFFSLHIFELLEILSVMFCYSLALFCFSWMCLWGENCKYIHFAHQPNAATFEFMWISFFNVCSRFFHTHKITVVAIQTLFFFDFCFCFVPFMWSVAFPSVYIILFVLLIIYFSIFLRFNRFWLVWDR